MKRLTCLLLIVLLISCNSKTALNYSESIVKREKSLEAAIKYTEDMVEKYIEVDNYDSMAVVSGRLEKQIDIELQAIKNEKAPDVKEGDNFKRAAIDYFAFIKSIYSGYVRFSTASDDDQRAEIYQELQEMVNKKDDVIKDMRDAQAKYAKANGFRLEE